MDKDSSNHSTLVITLLLPLHLMASLGVAVAIVVTCLLT
jgi:hypothetical protein